MHLNELRMCSKGFSADDELLKVGCSLCYKALLSWSDVNMKSWKSPSKRSFWRKHTDGVFSSGLDWMRSFMEMSFQAGNLLSSVQSRNTIKIITPFPNSFPRTPTTKPHFGSLSLKLSREPLTMSLMESYWEGYEMRCKLKLWSFRVHCWQFDSFDRIAHRDPHEPVKPPYDVSQERMPSELMSVRSASLSTKSPIVTVATPPIGPPLSPMKVPAPPSTCLKLEMQMFVPNDKPMRLLHSWLNRPMHETNSALPGFLKGSCFEVRVRNWSQGAPQNG